MIYVFLANGFEEIEGLTVVDFLRRAELEVCTVGVGGKLITGAHNIPVFCDLDESEVRLDSELEAVVLPCGWLQSRYMCRYLYCRSRFRAWR